MDNFIQPLVLWGFTEISMRTDHGYLLMLFNKLVQRLHNNNLADRAEKGPLAGDERMKTPGSLNPVGGAERKEAGGGSRVEPGEMEDCRS